MRNIDAGVLRLALSDEIEEEYTRKLGDRRVGALFERHGVALHEVREVIAELCRRATRHTLTGDAPAFRDEKDRAYLHCAEIAAADYLVTFDSALLEHGVHGRTIILTPADLLHELNRRRLDIVD